MMQSPSGSIQSPRPPVGARTPSSTSAATATSSVPFDKELMTSLHVMLNQLGEVERQGLVMFHKIEESFKHPYSQNDAIADTANLTTQLDTLMDQAKSTGFGALTLLPTSPTVVSTPSASSSFVHAPTPKPTFLSPRMQNHIHNNLNIQLGPAANASATATTTANPAGAMTTPGTGSNLADTPMLSPGVVSSLVSTPASASATAAATFPVSASPTTTPHPTGSSSALATPSPFPGSSDAAMTTPTTATATAADPLAVAAAAAASSSSSQPATSSVHPGAALTQMMDARHKDVQALYTEKRKLKTNLTVAATMVKLS